MEQQRAIWGQRIRTLRKAAGYSQRTFSIALNIDQANVSRWERGLIAPRDEHRLLIAHLLGVSATELFSYEPDNGSENAA